jgi:3-dehydroquinate dehydratase-2
MKKILVIHGPNLNLLGKRETDIYGGYTLEEINGRIYDLARGQKVEVETFQSNSEGELVSKIQKADAFDALVINPAAYTHTSVAIRDAILAVGIPTVEVHLSNIYQRESFRQESLLSDIVEGQVVGFGVDSYLLGMQAAINLLQKETE